MKITVVGLGYVGLANAILLAKKNAVTAIDVDLNKIDILNKGQSPINDRSIVDFIHNNDCKIIATRDSNSAYMNAEYVVICTPTDYNESTKTFDTTSICNVIQDVLQTNTSATIIIKSTIPIGFTRSLQEKFQYKKIIFCPEFLREGKAMYDITNPSRIVISSNCDSAKKFIKLMLEVIQNKSVKCLFVGSEEAESIKLFSNTYLAMRVAFFNELDSFSESNGLSSKQIISGVCMDDRIGDYYNNPSFGYGGYCLPKDTKELKSTFSDIPNSIITAIVNSNETRSEHIVNQIKSKSIKTVGIYRLLMKLESDNFRSSSIFRIISKLMKNGLNIIIYEPTLKSPTYLDLDVVNTLTEFKLRSELIVANRLSDELTDVLEKTYSRDLFGSDF